MGRKSNTNRDGGAWTYAQKKEVWEKGTTIYGKDQDVWRIDDCGEEMNWFEHGNRDSDYGWEIDHIMPVSKGGGDNIGNLQPLKWENNAEKGDSLDWSCP